MPGRVWIRQGVEEGDPSAVGHEVSVERVNVP